MGCVGRRMATHLNILRERLTEDEAGVFISLLDAWFPAEHYKRDEILCPSNKNLKFADFIQIWGMPTTVIEKRNRKGPFSFIDIFCCAH